MAGTAVLMLVPACAPAPPWALLRQDAAGRLSVTENPLTESPSFIRASLPVATAAPGARSAAAVARQLFDRYEGLFGLREGGRDLELVREWTGSLGMEHVTFRQMARGIPVYGAETTVHVSDGLDRVVAVTGSLIPGARLRPARPRIDAGEAERRAVARMPDATVLSSTLVAYPGRARSATLELSWLVDLWDEAAPSRRTWVVSARNGRILDVIDRLPTGRSRRTHSADNRFELPGTLLRSEDDGPSGDADVDHAHDFAGDTYDYFLATHGRDSYDGRGATITSTVHYRDNYQNAFWNGQQMAYGDGFAVKDVVAHEITHAVTEHSARLDYRWQSGALNESYSDIFGSMVDRDDWLVGEDLPRGPIRNMADPKQFNHPDHADDWRAMCGDNEGVHINSGIHNRAYVNVAEAVGKDRAERIFYRALTTYLGPQSSFEDSRAAALQSAEDLFGATSTEVEAVDRGFAAVGIDGSFDPGPGGCRGAGDESLGGALSLVALAMGLLGLARTFRRP